MHDLTLARLIHEERQREIERNLRSRAAREALRPCAEETYVPPERPTRITHPGMSHPLRPASSGGRSS